MPIRRLLYTSASRLEPTGLTVEEQVADIVQQAAKCNKRAGITGLLVFVEGQFIQIIEGESTAVEATFERICCDFRHAQVKLVDLVAVKDRLFAGWSMAHLCEGEDPGSSLDEDLRNVRYLLGVNARVAVERMHDYLLGRSEIPIIALAEGEKLPG
jgi:hypothetical protein